MAQLYGPPSDGSVIPHELEDAIAADLTDESRPIGAAAARRVAPDAGETFAAKLDAGIGDAVLTIMGDSTGNANDEWVRLTVDTLATAHPAARVVYVPWDSTAEAYGTPVQVQAGDVPATGVVFSDTFARTGDVYGSTPDVGPAWGGYSNAAGDWVMDGADAVRTEDATGSDLTADFGQTGDVEVRLDATINTLARPATKQIKVYLKYLDFQNCVYVQITSYANGGTAWSLDQRISNTVTTLATGAAGDITATVESAPLALAIRQEGSTVTATVNGTSRTVTLDAAVAEVVAPLTKAGLVGSETPTGAMGDRLHFFEVEALGTAAPEQTVTIYNASESGSTLDYHSARLSTVLAVAPDLVILSSSHNYGSLAPADYLAAVDAFVEEVRAMYPAAGIAVSSQNPQKAPAGNVAPHAARLIALRAAALRKGWGYVPAFEFFRAQADRGESLIASDGVHPTAAGSALWEDAATAFLNGLSLAP